MRQVIIPLAPGLFSAVGLLASDPQHDDVRPYLSPSIEHTRLNDVFAEMEGHMLDRLVADGYGRGEIMITRSADMRYSGQKGILKIAVPQGMLVDEDIEAMCDRLDDEHLKTYGHHKARQSAQVANLRIRAICSREGLTPLPALASAERSSRSTKGETRTRQAFFGPDVGLLETPILTRMDLDGGPRKGPLIIEEMDATTIVPPFAVAQLDDLANVVLGVS
jgi:N-methylhydantoinase A